MLHIAITEFLEFEKIQLAIQAIFIPMMSPIFSFAWLLYWFYSQAHLLHLMMEAVTQVLDPLTICGCTSVVSQAGVWVSYISARDLWYYIGFFSWHGNLATSMMISCRLAFVRFPAIFWGRGQKVGTQSAVKKNWRGWSLEFLGSSPCAPENGFFNEAYQWVSFPLCSAG